MLKEIQFIVLLIILYTSSNSIAEEYSVLTNSKIPVFQSTALLLKKKLTSNGKSAKIYDLKDTSEQRVLENISKGMIFSIGKQSSELAVKTKQPFIFSHVTRPQFWGFINQEGKTIGNYAGLSMAVSPEKYFSLLMKYTKIPLHPILFYSKNESNHTALLYKKAAKKYGIDLIIKDINKSDEIMPELHKLKKTINMVISIPDAIAYSIRSVKMLLQFSLRNKIPFIGYTKYHTKAGAVLSIYPDELAFSDEIYSHFIQITSGNNPLETISLYYLKTNNYAINQQTIKLFTQYFNKDTFKNADERY